MCLVHVPTETINLADHKYSFGSSRIPDRLVRSVYHQGILNPVKLLNIQGIHTVLTGWKRIKICNDLKRSKIPAIVYDPDNIIETDRIMVIFEDNFERITELDKADLLSMLKQYTDLCETEISDKYMQMLGINPGLKNYEKYIRLSELDKEIKNSYYDEQYSIEHLILFSGITHEKDRNAIFERLFKRYRFNINESREVIRNITEYCLRETRDVSGFLDQLLDENGKTPTKSELRELLKEKRVPGYKAAEDKFNETSGKMDLDNNISLKYHPYFETNELEFCIKFKESQKLANSIEKLSNEIENGNIDLLLKILKNGA